MKPKKINNYKRILYLLKTSLYHVVYATKQKKDNYYDIDLTGEISHAFYVLANPKSYKVHTIENELDSCALCVLEYFNMEIEYADECTDVLAVNPKLVKEIKTLFIKKAETAIKEYEKEQKLKLENNKDI